MPSVVTFWQLSEEESHFIDYLTAKEDIWGHSLRDAADPSELPSQPLRDVLTQEDSTRLVMTPRAFTDLVHFTPFEMAGEIRYYWYLGDAAVVDYTRPIWLESGELCRSNLCCYPQRFAPDASSPDGESLVPQPPAFMAWQRRVYAWVRRHTQKFGWYRATPAVIAALGGGLTLYPDPGPI